jgi:hypothetical protein
MTDNTMTKRKRTKGQTTIIKIINIKGHMIYPKNRAYNYVYFFLESWKYIIAVLKSKYITIFNISEFKMKTKLPFILLTVKGRRQQRNFKNFVKKVSGFL